MLASGTPYTINQSGSYRLSSNLAANTTVISIQAPNVTIDLNGFSILTTSNGIISGGTGTTILNGSVTGVGPSTAAGGGIAFYQPGARVDHVTVSNLSTGISASGDLTVDNCVVKNNSNWGVWGSGTTLTVSRSVISGSGSGAIGVSGGAALITGNTITGSVQTAIMIYTGSKGATVTNNAILGNASFGIAAYSTTGIGSNTFGGNGAGDWGGIGIVSMKNNVCEGSVC